MRLKALSIKEMLCGIQASKDVKLSNISRTLKEEQSLIKAEDRGNPWICECPFCQEARKKENAIHGPEGSGQTLDTKSTYTPSSPEEGENAAGGFRLG